MLHRFDYLLSRPTSLVEQQQRREHRHLHQSRYIVHHSQKHEAPVYYSLRVISDSLSPLLFGLAGGSWMGDSLVESA